MRRSVLVLFLALAATACGGDPAAVAPTPAPPSFVRVDIPRPATSFEYTVDRPGDTVQLHAVASFSDGSTTDVTAEAAWTIAGPPVVSVARGLVTGLAEGGTTVQASYRGWSTITNVRVGVPPAQRPYPVSGIVRDAATGAPLAGAELRTSIDGSENTIATTDANGFFNLGDVNVRMSLLATKLGYQDATVFVSEAATLVVLLEPIPGRHIERTLAGTLAPTPSDFEETRTTVHLTTRAGGVLDAKVGPTPCANNGNWLRILAESGGQTFAGPWGGPCGARIRFIVPAPDVQFTIVGLHGTDWVLTVLEPL